MSKIANRFMSAIAVGIVAVIYSILVFVLKDMEQAGANFWGGYAFTMVAFAILATLMCLTKISTTKTIATQAPLYFGTLIYVGLTFIINIIFICLNKDTNATAMVVINVIILLVYAIYMIVMYMGMRHMDVTSKKIVEKREHTAELEIKVGMLVYSAKDEAVKRALTALKEDVKYGGRMGSDANPQALSAEESFINQLDVVKALLSSGADTESVLGAVEEASNLFKMRNEILIKFS